MAVIRNTQIHERTQRLIRGGSRKRTLDGANTITLMKRKDEGRTHV